MSTNCRHSAGKEHAWPCRAGELSSWGCSGVNLSKTSSVTRQRQKDKASVARAGFGSCGSGLWSRGSIVVAHRLSCSVACGIFLDQRWNSCLLHWQVDSLPLSYQGGPGPRFREEEIKAGCWHADLVSATTGLLQTWFAVAAKSRLCELHSVASSKRPR